VLIVRGRSRGSALPNQVWDSLSDPRSHRASTPENNVPRIVPCLIWFWNLTLDAGSHRTLIARR